MLIKTIPSDQTSAARGLYVGATLFLNSVRSRRRLAADSSSNLYKTPTIAHIRRTAAIHVGGLKIGGRETEIGEFDDDFTFSSAIWQNRPTIRYDEVFGFYVTMEDLLIVTCSHCLAHLREHRCDEPETIAREELGKMQIGKETRRGRCS